MRTSWSRRWDGARREPRRDEAVRGAIAPLVYEPGYLATDRIVRIETNAHRVSDARLVWSARSETPNPSNAEQPIEEVARAAVEAIRRDALLPPAASP